MTVNDLKRLEAPETENRRTLLHRCNTAACKGERSSLPVQIGHTSLLLPYIDFFFRRANYQENERSGNIGYRYRAVLQVRRY